VTSEGKKEELLARIKSLDDLLTSDEATGNEGEERSRLKSELEALFEEEEIYWQQRGAEKQILEGDANTTFLDLSANGRRRKKTILSLEQDGVNISDQKQIREIIYEFYKKHFGKQAISNVSLSENAWTTEGRLSSEDNEFLTRPFSEEEVKRVVFDMKENTAPGPDGFSVTFYKYCWEIVKGDFMDMVNDFYLGNLDIGRLNYGVITLIPKVKDANNIKQFKPIHLLNVSFKIFTKFLLDRLTVVAGKLVSKWQSAFIKGRYILDGAVMLHEIMHELRARKE